MEQSMMFFIKGKIDESNGDIGLAFISYMCNNLKLHNKDTPDIKSQYDSISFLNRDTQHIVVNRKFETSHNLAEHMAVEMCLEHVLDYVTFDCKIYIMIDTLFVAEQMNQKSKINAGVYADQARKNISKLLDMQEAGYNIEFIWIPNKLNKKANDLAVLHFTKE